jgi:hypothetical protein
MFVDSNLIGIKEITTTPSMKNGAVLQSQIRPIV